MSDQMNHRLKALEDRVSKLEQQLTPDVAAEDVPPIPPGLETDVWHFKTADELKAAASDAFHRMFRRRTGE